MTIKTKKKFTILLTPFNATGHINGSLGFAMRLADLIDDCRIVVATINKLMDSNLNQLKDKRIETIEINRRQWPSEALNELEKLSCDFKLNYNKTFINHIEDTVSKIMQRKNIENVFNLLTIGQARYMADSINYKQDFERIINQVDPDVIIADSFYGQQAIKFQTKVPWVNFFSVQPLGLYKSKLKNKAKPIMFFGEQLLNKEERQALRLKQPQQLEALIEKWIKNKEIFDEKYKDFEPLWRDFAIKSNESHLIGTTTEFTDASPFMNIYMYPKALDYDQDDDLFEIRPNWINCETSVLLNLNVVSQVEQFWSDKIKKFKSFPGNENKPLIYFSLGSLASSNVTIMTKYVEMLSLDTKRLYIISKGAQGYKYDLNEPNMIGANFLPQIHLLQKVDAAIIHGGNNSTTECMFVGVPCIVMPVFGDQFDNAQRFEDLKLGLKLDVFSCTKEELFEALKNITENSQIKAKVKQISVEMRQRDECGKVAKALFDKLILNCTEKKNFCVSLNNQTATLSKYY